MSGRRTGGLTVGGAAFRGRLASSPSVTVTIFVATLLTAFLITAVPRLLERVSADDLREAVAEAEPEQRNIRAESGNLFFDAGPHEEPFRQVKRYGEELVASAFPGSVQTIIVGSQFVVETPRFAVSSFPDSVTGPFPTFMNLRYQQDVMEELTLVTGSLPQARDPIEMLAGPECPDGGLPPEDFAPEPEGLCTVADIPVFEVAITEETAEAMRVSAGDQLILRPDGSDRRWFGTPFLALHDRVVLAISGIVELSDPDGEYWFADTSLHRPRIEENPDFRLIYATGLYAPDQYGALLEAMPFVHQHHTWRYLVDPGRLEEVPVAQLQSDLSKISAPSDVRIVTFLPDLIDEFVSQRSLTIGLMSTAITGVLVTAVAVILTLALLVATRDVGATVLMRSRGASRSQLLLSALCHGLVLVVPAVVLGYAATRALLPGTDSVAPARAAIFLASGGVAAVVGAAATHTHRRLGSLQRSPGEPEGPGYRRLVLEGFVIVCAVAAVLLLRRRGLTEGTGPGTEGVDLLLASAPAVIGVAAGLVAVRLMGPIARFTSWLLGRGRAVAAFVGLRRLLATPASGRLPVIVILLAVGVAIFSAVVRDSIAEGVTEHVLQVVGAGYRVNAHDRDVPLPSTIDIDDLAGDGPRAMAAEFPTTTVIGIPGSPPALFFAIDVPAYREVLANAGADSSFLDPIAGSEGDGRLRVLVSRSWSGQQPPPIGSGFILDMGPVDPRVEVVGIIERFPSLPPLGAFVIADLQALRAVEGIGALPATVAFFDAPARSGEEVAADLAEMHPTARLLSRERIRSNLTSDPFALWVGRGLTAVIYLATGFAVVAALSSLSLTAARRRRDLGYLRTLGLRSGEARVITGLEQLPPVVLATLVGAALGAGVAALLSPALDITSFTGGLLPGEIVVDMKTVALVGAVLIGLLAAAVVTFVAVGRRQDEAGLLKIGDQ